MFMCGPRISRATAIVRSIFPLTAPAAWPLECPASLENFAQSLPERARISRAGADSEHGIHALLKNFANSNQDSRRKRHRKFSSFSIVRRRNAGTLSGL